MALSERTRERSATEILEAREALGDPAGPIHSLDDVFDRSRLRPPPKLFIHPEGMVSIRCRSRFPTGYLNLASRRHGLANAIPKYSTGTNRCPGWTRRPLDLAGSRPAIREPMDEFEHGSPLSSAGRHDCRKRVAKPGIVVNDEPDRQRQDPLPKCLRQAHRVLLGGDQLGIKVGRRGFETSQDAGQKRLVVGKDPAPDNLSPERTKHRKKTGRMTNPGKGIDPLAGPIHSGRESFQGRPQNGQASQLRPIGRQPVVVGVRPD